MSPHTILLVEDEPLVRELVHGFLEHGGYEVLDAATAADAAKAAAMHAGTIDLLITDIQLPGGADGAQLAVELRQARPGIKLMFMSGNPGDKARLDVILQEGAVYLRKPFTRAVLLANVREQLGNPSP